MEFGGSVWRHRRQLIPNPANPDRPTEGPWSTADIVEITGAAVLKASDSPVVSESRAQALAAKSLFLDNPAADVRKGDGISLRPGLSTPEFTVEVVPSADQNPFTGWRPVLEVPLKGANG